MPDNTKAKSFWQKIVKEYSKDNFIKTTKNIGPTKFHPKNYEMIVFKFSTNSFD
jgi:hypothetical protein